LRFPYAGLTSNRSGKNIERLDRSGRANDGSERDLIAASLHMYEPVRLQPARTDESINNAKTLATQRRKYKNYHGKH
jgi:hypothetical protein